MNQKLTSHEETAIIESIIYTFEGYTLDHLRTYRYRTDRTGILLIQALDDLSGFLFTGSPRERINQFVSAYLPQYAKLAVYDILKNSLRYNYVVAIIGDDPSTNSDLEASPIAIDEELPWEAILDHLGDAFRLAFEDLRNNSEKRQLALEWHKTHKVCHGPSSIYTPAQQQKLQNYYLPLLTANSLFPGHTGDIYLYFSPQRDDNYHISVEIEDRRVAKYITRIPLDLVIAWMGLRKVEEVLA